MKIPSNVKIGLLIKSGMPMPQAVDTVLGKGAYRMIEDKLMRDLTNANRKAHHG